MLAGCQAAENVQPAASTQEVQKIPQTPYTRGPTTPPAVKGPNRPLPVSTNGSGDNGLPQAMTEQEVQNFTLNSY